MRNALILLSLALNGLLLAALVSPRLAVSAYSHLRPAKPEVKSTRDASGPAGGRAAVAPPVAVPAQAATAWSALDTASPRELIERLLATGMPPLLVRGVVEAKLNREIVARRAELRAANPPAPYWNELARANPKIDFKAAADLRTQERRNLALLDATLGPDTSLIERNNPLDRFKYGDLAWDKTGQAKVIDQDYDELNTLVTGGMLGITLPGDREQVAQLRLEKEQDLRSALSPEEYETYLLWSSRTAENLRFNLAAFQPTEEEFRAIFRLQRAYDEKYPFGWMAYSPGLANAEEMTARQQESTALREQIKAALGPERGMEYEQETNYNFRQLSQAAPQLGLTKAAVVQAWNIQQEFNQRAAAVTGDRTLRPVDITPRLNQLRSELTDRLHEVLGGQPGLELYNRNPLPGGIRPLAAPTAK